MTITQADFNNGHLKKHSETATTAALSLSAPAARPGQLISVTLHASAAATTSESMTITLDANAGAAYDTVLYSLNLSTSSTVNLLWQPTFPLWLTTGDAIAVAFTNTDDKTIGCEVTIVEEL